MRERSQTVRLTCIEYTTQIRDIRLRILGFIRWSWLEVEQQADGRQARESDFEVRKTAY